MDIQKLTKKNQEFIHIATNQLIKDGKSDQEIKDILSDVIPELIKNQKKGITGRGFLGAPTVWAASFSPEKHQQAVSGKPSKEIPETDKTPWKMWLDTSLFLLSIVAIMNAIFGFSGTQTSYGLTTLHLLVALLCIPLTTISIVIITNQKKNVLNGGLA